VREPRTALAHEEACLLEPLLHVIRMRHAVRHEALLVDEHADARRLPIAPQEELRRNGARSALVEDLGDAIGVLPRPVAEEREREMEILGANTPRLGGVEAGRPGGELARWSSRDGQSNEEA
jgi:hypothetical protein